MVNMELGICKKHKKALFSHPVDLFFRLAYFLIYLSVRRVRNCVVRTQNSLMHDICSNVESRGESQPFAKKR